MRSGSIATGGHRFENVDRPRRGLCSRCGAVLETVVVDDEGHGACRRNDEPAAVRLVVVADLSPYLADDGMPR
jgi:hypothetical protein